MNALKSLFASRRSATPEEKELGSASSRAVEREVSALLAEGKKVEALRVAERALAACPGAPVLAYLHGLSLEHLGRNEEALVAYRTELTVNSGHRDAHARAEALAKALTPPVAGIVSARQRSWHTSIPRAFLLELQRAHHFYDYRGVPLLKNPFDLALYPRLLWKLKPLTIIEIGSKSGGSGLWLGDLLNNFGIDGRIYSYDIVRVDSVSHPRVTFLEGNGRALGETLRPDFLQGMPRPWLVIEDADHAYETSIAVLNFFHSWLRPEDYIIIEDGIISDLSELPEGTSGPHRALREFLGQHEREYGIDTSYCDFFGPNVTWCTNGFLKRLGPPSQAEATPPPAGKPR